MEFIKQFVRTPKNHEILIKIPQSIPENDLVEIILILREKQKDFDKKINDLKTAMKDKLFLDDLNMVSEEFASLDLMEWEK